MKFRLSVTLWALSVAACGGSVAGQGGGAPQVTGTVGGQPVPAAADGIGLVGTETQSGVVASYAGVVITNLAGTCGLVQQNTNPANASALSILIITSGATASNAVAAGTYSVVPQPTATPMETFAVAEYVVNDANCTKTTSESAASGTVTLSAVSSTVVSGTFDLAFPDGGNLTGSFSSPVCDVNLTTVGQSAPTACQR